MSAPVCVHPPTCGACRVRLACRCCQPRRSPNAGHSGTCLRCDRGPVVTRPVVLSPAPVPVTQRLALPTPPRASSPEADPVALRLARRHAARVRAEGPAMALPVPVSDDETRRLNAALDDAATELREAQEWTAKLDKLVDELERERDEARSFGEELRADMGALVAWALEAGAEPWRVATQLTGAAARVVQLQAGGLSPEAAGVEAADLFAA